MPKVKKVNHIQTIPMTPTSRVIALADYQPHPRNYNRHPAQQVERIAISLRKFGQVRSVVVWRNYFLAGHGVREAALSLGWDSLRADVLPDDYPEQLALAYVAADNELGRMGDPDQEQLAAILSESRAYDAELLQAIGYDDREFDRLLAEVGGLGSGASAGDAEPQIDRAEELRQKWQVAPGQLWALGDHRLICGDCTDAATVARLMGGEKAQMMFTDPPYGISFEGQILNHTSVNGVRVNNRTSANTKHKAIENDELMGESLASFCFDFLGLAKTTGVKAWYICFSQLDLDLLLSAMRKSGFEWRSIIAWVKNESTLSGKDYKLRYEPIVYGQSGGAFHGERYHEEDVWEITRTLKNDLHPTMKPVDLVERAVKNSSQANDIVYEPFSGSGTTLIACQNLGRKCRAVELSPAYVAVALQRFADAFGIEPRLIDG